jgi:hypothetical protein
METMQIDSVQWYADPDSARNNEPGIQHSYMACLATALNHITGGLDPVWLMGSSSFAFRIVVNETLCPSAMSIFDWTAVLPEAIKNAGHQCTYVSRLWHESDKMAERQQEAHDAILAGLRDGHPAVVWDVHDVEWGLIVGYDERREEYLALSFEGKDVTLPRDRLGQNGIDILSVAIPHLANNRSRDDMIANSLRAAVRHAEGQEWMDRPKYQDGLAAFDLWSLIYERGAMLAEAGKGENISSDVLDHARYYAAHYYGARCYARDYLRMIADGDTHLTQAAECYGRIAEALRIVWDSASAMQHLKDATLLRAMSKRIKAAGAAETEGIEALNTYLVARDKGAGVDS